MEGLCLQMAEQLAEGYERQNVMRGRPSSSDVGYENKYVHNVKSLPPILSLITMMTNLA